MFLNEEDYNVIGLMLKVQCKTQDTYKIQIKNKYFDIIFQYF